MINFLLGTIRATIHATSGAMTWMKEAWAHLLHQGLRTEAPPLVSQITSRFLIRPPGCRTPRVQHSICSCWYQCERYSRCHFDCHYLASGHPPFFCTYVTSAARAGILPKLIDKFVAWLGWVSVAQVSGFHAHFASTKVRARVS